VSRLSLPGSRVHPEKDRGERATTFANSLFLRWERVARATLLWPEVPQTSTSPLI